MPYKPTALIDGDIDEVIEALAAADRAARMETSQLFEGGFIRLKMPYKPTALIGGGMAEVI